MSINEIFWPKQKCALDILRRIEEGKLEAAKSACDVQIVASAGINTHFDGSKVAFAKCEGQQKSKFSRRWQDMQHQSRASDGNS